MSVSSTKRDGVTLMLKRERSDHTLQTTALVHETYMKFADQRVLKWKNRAHFFVAASEIMRYLLVDHARKRNREKRGGDLNIQRLDSDLQIASKSPPVDLIALDEALKRLEGWDRQQAKIVELRYFGGCSFSETAEILAEACSGASARPLAPRLPLFAWRR